MRAYVRDLGVSHQTVPRALKKVGGKNHVMVKRPLGMEETHLRRCKILF
uniref:Uncharacterized protein n=1 Tax=Lepeophtheirus salmonis TaxID=72036 RepID=A0A0K2SXB1_LEPSM